MLKGEILWWDKSKGEGEVYCPNTAKTYYVHYSAVPKNKFLVKGMKVYFRLYTNLYMSQVDFLKPMLKIV